MKRNLTEVIPKFGYILFAACFTLACKAPGQEDYRLEFPLTNFIWRGFYQPINIEFPEEGELVLKIPAGVAFGEIQKYDNQFMIRPNRVGYLTIEIYVEKDGNEEFKKSHTIAVKELPNLKPRLCSQEKGDTVSIERVLTCQKIEVTTENFDINAIFRVESFSLVTFTGSDSRIVTSSNSEKFTSEQISQLKSLKPGQCFYIEDIQVEVFGAKRGVEIMNFVVSF